MVDRLSFLVFFIAYSSKIEMAMKMTLYIPIQKIKDGGVVKRELGRCPISYQLIGRSRAFWSRVCPLIWARQQCY